MNLRYGDGPTPIEDCTMKHASLIAIVTLAAGLSACGQGDSAPNTSAVAPAPAAAPAEPTTPITAPVVAEPLTGAPTPAAAADEAVK